MNTTRVIGIAIALVAVGMIGIGAAEEVGFDNPMIQDAAACEQPGKCGSCSVDGGSIDGTTITAPSIRCNN